MPSLRSDLDTALSVLMTMIAALGEHLATDGATALPPSSASRARRLADLQRAAADAVVVTTAAEILLRRRRLLG